MKKITILFLTVILLSCTKKPEQKASSVVVKDTNSRTVTFFCDDSFVTSELKPDSVYYRNSVAPYVVSKGLVYLKDGHVSTLLNEFLILSGDSVVMERLGTNDNQLRLTDNSCGIYASPYFNDSTTDINLTKLLFKKISLESFFEAEKQIRFASQQKIDSISGVMKKYQKPLTYLNKLRYYKHILEMTNKLRPEYLKAIDLVKQQENELQTFIREKNIVIHHEYISLISFYINYELLKVNKEGLVNFVAKIKELNLPQYLVGVAANHLSFQEHKETKDYQDALKLLRAYAQETGMATVLPRIKGLEHKKLLLSQLDTQVSLEDIHQQKTTLQELIRQSQKEYTIIDCWASWCAPCVAEIPNWEKMKEKYGRQIQFISLSVDKKKTEWEAKSKTLLLKEANYWTPSEGNIAISRFFEISSIPKYIIIAKNGTVVNASFYRPSDPRFELELKKLLK